MRVTGRSGKSVAQTSCADCRWQSFEIYDSKKRMLWRKTMRFVKESVGM